MAITKVYLSFSSKLRNIINKHIHHSDISTLILSFSKTFRNKNFFAKQNFQHVYIHRLTSIQTMRKKWKKKQPWKTMFLQWKTKTHRYYENRSKGECKIIKSINSNCIVMEEPSHFFTAHSLPGNCFIAFRIFLVFVAHFF